MNNNKEMFEFGKNWQRFVESYLDSNRIEKAVKSLQNFLKVKDLKGKTFLDIGCGSGLFSLAAFKLGAKNIMSIDLDPFSVKCCEHLKEKANSPQNWKILQLSILDSKSIQALGKYDIVYSWGVLHHTGEMWNAIFNASLLVEDNGLFYLAIYNKADGLAMYPDGRIGSSKFWRRIKAAYYALPLFLQNIIDYSLMSILVAGYILTLNNPLKKIRSYQDNFRGMSWRIDIKDWLGGFPYEFASVTEIFKYMKELGFQLENLDNNNGLRNNEFLLRKLNTAIHSQVLSR